MNSRLTCYVIGDDSLLIQCSETLLRKDHEIFGVITSNSNIKKWAAEKDLRVYNPDKSLVKILTSKPYDYLFSITNLQILADEIVNSPQKAAINFHDGPLPKYAGINATSWALMDRVKNYGITWHEITSEVDKGDILKQVLFDVSENETALSLNAKCFEAGSNSFEDLVDELASGNVKHTKQNFGERTYFGKFKRPANAALINWNNEAETITAFVRALNFGRYTNPLGLPKVKIGERYFIITELESTGKKSIENPGTVTEVGKDYLIISTKTFDLKATRFLSVSGKTLTIDQLTYEYSIKAGSRLYQLNGETSKKLSDFYTSIAKKEEYWVKQISASEPVELHYTKREKASDKHPDYLVEELNIPKNIVERVLKSGSDFRIQLASIFGLFIGRHSGKEKFTIGFSNTDLNSVNKDYGELFAEIVPVNIELIFDNSFNTALLKNSGAFEKALEAKTFSNDIFLRYPSLNKIFHDEGMPNLPVTVVFLSGKNERITPRGSIVLVVTPDNDSLKFIYDASTISTDSFNLLKAQFVSFLEEALNNPESKISSINILSPIERRKIFEEWNNTKLNFPSDKCIHTLFEEQVEKTPRAVAVFCRGNSITYRDLNTRANQVAAKLNKLGVGPETLVGLCLHRSVDMMVAILGILKAGGAYVPLDPAFPKDRILYMIEDSGCPVIITEQDLKKELSPGKAKLISIDTEWNSIAKENPNNPVTGVHSENLSYVIYTSGSTGKPKGVMVQHRNVVNFFTGMDKHIKHDPPGVWLAVTSLSFDISVLELLWTLTRGFKVVIYAEEDWKSEQIKFTPLKNARKIDFSLFYFSSYESENPEDKYRLLIEGAKFADQNRFSAVWTPERHFHDFGGLYPNPAVIGAGLAALTQHVRIMSGSCVSPLHHPARIAEEWSVVDNLSKGRIGISFAAGWQPNDFVLIPQNYDRRKEIMFEQIEIVRKLWRGEEVEFDAPYGKKIKIKTLPRPIQKEVPVWITAANNPETFQMAGERGFYLLTHLLGQTIEDLEDKIALYRDAWRKNGHGPGDGYVSLMLHTFVGENLEEVKEIVREPMKSYLNSAASLVKLASWYFPTFDKMDESFNEAASNLTKEDMDAILNHAFERYFETSALLGTPETCLRTVEKLKKVGVDDVACLIDFGVDSEKVLDHLQYLNAVKTLANLGVQEQKKTEVNGNYSIPELIDQHKVTHMQCTPSMAKMLLLDENSASLLKKLEYLLIGGEAFPVSLAEQLSGIVSGKILNMYGPTETTIWSSTYTIDGKVDSVPIGRPIANTQIFILDSNNQPTPIGVPGELCIGGEGVVRGYFQRPELTAQRFIETQFFNHDSSAKLYKTGDMAVYRPDGIIEFLGRFDHQVKIRGYRIELGEIETVLEKHPSLREVVVIAREDTPGDKRLTAYLVCSSKTKPSIMELRNYLKAALPDYMIPPVFVFMDELPLTPNGKVDRKALPKPEGERPDQQDNFIGPRTSTEKTIADLWSSVLGIEKIGIHDNFFDLGGHSLSAVQVTVKIHQAYNIDLTLQSFFQSASLEELAVAVEEKLLESTGEEKLKQLLSEIG